MRRNKTNELPFTVLKSYLSLNSGFCSMRDILLVLPGEFTSDWVLSLYNFGDWSGRRNLFGVGAELVILIPIADILMGLSSLLTVDLTPSYIHNVYCSHVT